MKYLLLGFRDESRWNALNPVLRARFAEARRHFDDELRTSTNVLARYAFSSAADAFHLGAADTAYDPASGGSYGRELRDLIVIEARDMNEAIRVASVHPGAWIGEPSGWSVEIRPVESLNDPGDPFER